MKALSIFLSSVLFAHAASGQGPQSPGTPTALPPVMHFCAFKCMTLTLNNGQYDSSFQNGSNATVIWTVENFSPESVVIHRKDSSGFTAIFRGQISKDGDRLINVTMNGAPAAGAFFTWGNALNSIPGSNAERDGKKAILEKKTGEDENARPSGAPYPGGPSVPATSVSHEASAIHKASGDVLNVPEELAECEGFTSGECQSGSLTNTWTFTGREGTGRFGTGAVAKLTVEAYGPQGLTITRVNDDNAPLPGLTAIYKGTVNGNRIEGTATWTWKGQSRSGFWNATIVDKSQQANSLPHSPIVDAVAQALQESMKPHPEDIILPPGAAPAFASFPAEMRAILRPSAPLPPGGETAACKDGAKFTDEQAMEIGKFAYRALDFDRANCWMKRLSDMGNMRATLILGGAKVMGLGMPKDPAGAFAIFKHATDTSPDPWGPYLLAECYENGYGTPVNKAAAARLNVLLMSVPAGQQVVMSVGADDRRMLADYNNFQRTLSWTPPPPKGYRRSCDALGLTCEDVKTESDPDD